MRKQLQAFVFKQKMMLDVNLTYIYLCLFLLLKEHTLNHFVELFFLKKL